MIRAAIDAGADWELVYGGRQRASMAFLDELEAHGDRVRVWPQEERGFLALADLLGNPASRHPRLLLRAGTPPQRRRSACATWPKGALHVERFVPKPLTEPVLAEAFEVS